MNPPSDGRAARSILRGQILASIREGLQRSLKFYVALFLLGFIVAFPLTSAFIGWLVDEGRLPAGVEIIVISPVEFCFSSFELQATSVSPSSPS